MSESSSRRAGVMRYTGDRSDSGPADIRQGHPHRRMRPNPVQEYNSFPWDASPSFANRDDALR